jgi:Na+-transporting NADH:ubiquinone oxidoreductase subunit A
MELFLYGVKVLETLSQGRIVISADHRSQEVIRHCRSVMTHTVSGHYPSDDPATVLYHIKASSDQNRAWTIAGQDVILLARMLSLGRYPTERIIAVGGSAAAHGRHYRTRIGVPLAHLVGPFDPQSRIVVGGLMRGHAAGPDDFMDLAATAVTLIPKGEEARFLALFNPGLTMPSYSRTFLSRLNSSRLVYDCNRNGGNRACIACMHCADVCPVDILPQMAYKAIRADEIEEALQHGLLDCVECGLCAYVCPSKIELSQTFKTARATYAKEIGRDSAASA